jgi:hypothetical protein
LVSHIKGRTKRVYENRVLNGIFEPEGGSGRKVERPE